MSKLFALAVLGWAWAPGDSTAAQERAPVSEERLGQDLVNGSLTLLEVAPVLSTAEREALEFDPNAPVLGDRNGTMTIVEFTDYNCLPCREVQPVIADLLDANPDIRWVIRERPVLGQASVAAARAALAAQRQGRFGLLHNAFLALPGPVGEGPLTVLAQVLQLDASRMRQDMVSSEVEEHLATSQLLAERLGVDTLPALVIGDAVFSGVLTADELTAAVEAARAEQPG